MEVSRGWGSWDEGDVGLEVGLVGMVHISGRREGKNMREIQRMLSLSFLSH